MKKTVENKNNYDTKYESRPSKLHFLSSAKILSVRKTEGDLLGLLRKTIIYR